MPKYIYIICGHKKPCAYDTEYQVNKIFPRYCIQKSNRSAVWAKAPSEHIKVDTSGMVKYSCAACQHVQPCMFRAVDPGANYCPLSARHYPAWARIDQAPYTDRVRRARRML